MRVTQVLAAAGPVDAVTGQVRAFRRLFGSWGWSGHDHAPVIAAGMPRGEIRPLRERRGREDVVIVHYSGYSRELPAVLEWGAPVLLISHNVTPPQWFWSAEPVEAMRCQLALEQLAELARRAACVAGVSAFNAAELEAASGRPARVLPILFSPPAGTENGADGVVPEGGAVVAPLVLFVGRLVPHKRQDLVIRAFARWRERRPDARLALVGTPLTPRYGDLLRELADAEAPGTVEFHAGVPAAALSELYHRATVFLCLSEHEGFCIPLLEAFAFGVPVVARAAAAVPEVAGDAAVLLEPSDGTAVVAEVLEIVCGDGELREELRVRGRRRLAAYERDEVAVQLRGIVESMVR